MIGQPQKQPRWVPFVAWTTVVLAVVGIYFVGRELSHVISGMAHAPAFRDSVGSAWKAFSSNLQTLIAISTIALALATVALWRTTKALSKSTNVEISIGGPLLVPVLHPSARFRVGLPDIFANLLPRPYWAGWRQQDQAEAAGALAAGDEFVNLYIINRSQNAHGAAVKISIKASLHFGIKTAPFRYQRTMTRTAEVPLCEPNSTFGLQFFNVSGLPDFMVRVDDMTYFDFMGRKRRGGWGYAVMVCGAKGTMMFPKVFQPRKGEYTDDV